MKRFTSFLTRLIVLFVLIGLGVVVVTQYSFIFSKNVRGETFNIERVIDPTMIVGGQLQTSQVFSFAVAVRDEKTGEIFTASSEDRQWAVVQKGQCVQAKFYPYPPWNFQKADTYFNARLIQMYDCAKANPAPSATPP